MMRFILAALLAVSLATPAEAATLIGSRAAIDAQNARADRQDYSRIKDHKMLARFKREGLVVQLRGGSAVRFHHRLAISRRWVRPEARDFVRQFAHDYYAAFKQPIQINSAGRTRVYQRKLTGSNANATHPDRSLHVRGMAIDVAKMPMSEVQRRWVRRYLLAREADGLIDATEEHAQLVFHIVVYKSRKR